MITIYVSTRCSNSSRLLNIIRRIPSLQGANIVDIDRGAPNGIEYVPTIVDERGGLHTGSKAFEYLKRFDAETEIQAMDIGSSGLSYGSLDHGGELDFTTPFGGTL